MPPMYEIALATTGIALFVSSYYVYSAFRRRLWVDAAYAIFSLAGALRFLNFYIWMNLPEGDPSLPFLRFIDFMLITPLILAGLEMLRSSTIVKLRGVEPWKHKLTYLIPGVSIPVVASFFLIFDLEFVRILGVVTIGPMVITVILYYLYLMKGNPYRQSKPEYAKGSLMVIFGFLILYLAEGILAGVFRFNSQAVVLQTFGLIVASVGGIVQGTSTFIHLFERIKIGLIVIRRDRQVEMTNLGGQIEVMGMKTNTIKIANQLVKDYAGAITQVFNTGKSWVLPYRVIDILDPGRLYQIDIVPHELDSTGKPSLVLMLINDVTITVAEKETEALAELLAAVVEERDRAEFYLDLLGHDMNNLLQGILFGMELLYLENPELDQNSENYKILKNQLGRSIDLVKDVETLAEARGLELETKPLDVEPLLLRAFDAAALKYSAREAILDYHPPNRPAIIQAEEQLEQGFVSLIAQCIASHKSDTVTIHIAANVAIERSEVNIEIGPYHGEFPDSVKGKVFDWRMKAKVPIHGIWLGLGRELARRYDGDIAIDDFSRDEQSVGSKFILSFPIAEKAGLV